MRCFLSGYAIALLCAFIACGCNDDAGAPGVSAPSKDVVENVDVKPTVQPDILSFDTQTPQDAGTSDSIDATVEAFPACDSLSDCGEGYDYCLAAQSGSGYCTVFCESDCPYGYFCKGTNAASDIVFVCVKDEPDACRPCEGGGDCGGSKESCLQVAEGKYCLSSCNSALECPVGYGCEKLDPNNGYCMPESGSCICTPELYLTTRVCTVTNDLGSCLGLETCTGPAGWEDCTARTPAEEICDGIDNDCDGFEDEDVPTESCLVEGKCPGVTECKGFAGYQCVGQVPLPETCNGIDDDCDGQTDNGLEDVVCGLGVCKHAQPPCDNGVPTVCNPFEGAQEEICNGLDDNCDGVADDDLGTTTCGLGVCAQTVPNCVDGKENSCNPLDGKSEEICDGKDNNCDGVVDEYVPLGPCDITNEFGTCAGTEKCNGFAGYECVGPTPTPESCNGVDDNCNGQTDETFPDLDNDSIANCQDDDIDGDGTLNGLDCAPENATIYPNAKEECDGIDNDCDNNTDEEFLDTDSDKVADCVDPDDDGDGVGDDDDCQPLDKTIFQGAPEVCNGIDDNCNGQTDEDSGDLDKDGKADCVDDDIDGDNDPNATDCDPKNASVHALATEACDGIDNNCKGGIDEGYKDSDSDKIANCIDVDDDNDGVCDGAQLVDGCAVAGPDNCPLVANADQTDTDKDGIGDACDLLEPGPLYKLVIRNKADDAGVEVTDTAVAVGETLVLVAAGYDNQGLYVGDQQVKWTVDGTLDVVSDAPSTTLNFSPKTPLTNGKITATSYVPNVYPDTTGTVTVTYPPLGMISLTESLVYADKTQLVAGKDSALVYVELMTQDGKPIADKQFVELNSSVGTLLGGVVYQGDGIYEQTLKGPAEPGVAKVTAKVNGISLAQYIEIHFVEEVNLTQAGIKSITCSNYPDLKGKNLVLQSGTVTVNSTGCSPMEFGKLHVMNSAKLVPPPCGIAPGRIDIKLVELRVDPDARIDATGRGHSYAWSGIPGTPIPKAAGGSHGGSGATATSVAPTYDSLQNPALPGSGGGAGSAGISGCGGGVVRITVANDGLAMINGTISASGSGGEQVENSKDPQYAGGAGGSIYLEAGKLLGTGSLEANGGSIPKANCKGWSTCGSPSRHGGGGGRIAIVGHSLALGSFSDAKLASSVTAYGGWGPEDGYAGAGTIFLKPSGQELGTLIVDNGGNSSKAGTPLPMVPEGTIVSVTPSTITGTIKFLANLYAGWQVNPKVPQGELKTLVDDTVFTVLSNSEDTLYFSPKAKANKVTSNWETFRGILKLDYVELRGGAHLIVNGDLVVMKGDLHSQANAFDVPAGSALTATTLEIVSGQKASITGDITTTQTLCSDCP